MITLHKSVYDDYDLIDEMEIVVRKELLQSYLDFKKGYADDGTPMRTIEEFKNMYGSIEVVELEEFIEKKKHEDLNKMKETYIDNKKFIEIIENDRSIGFDVNMSETSDFVDLEARTNGRVNMNIMLDDDFHKEFNSYVEYFDVDEMVDTHREDEWYRDEFTIRESLEDFEQFYNDLKALKERIDNTALDFTKLLSKDVSEIFNGTYENLNDVAREQLIETKEHEVSTIQRALDGMEEIFILSNEL